MRLVSPRRAARITAAAVGGVLAAGLGLPAGASAQAPIYKQYDNGVLAYSTQDSSANRSIHTMFQNGQHDTAVSTIAVPLGLKGIVGEWSADGTRLLLTDLNKDLLDVNPWTGAQIAKVDEPFEIKGPSMSPDGTVYAYGSLGHGTSFYRTDTSTTTQAFGAGTDADSTAWSNEDGLVVTDDGSSILRFVNASSTGTGTGNLVASETDFYPQHVTVSRDSTKAAYSAYGTNNAGPSNDVFLVKADGSTSPVKVEGNTDGSEDLLATISPNGTKIVFASDRAGDGTWSLYIRNISAGTTTKVPNTTLPAGTTFSGLSWQPAGMPNLAQGQISSATEVGNTLRLDEMFDTPTAPVYTTWQWQTCTGVDSYNLNGTCTNVSGATSAGYTLTSSDLGKRFRVVRQVTNGVGTDTDASLITQEIEDPPPADTTPPGVPTITTKPGAYANATAPTLAWTGAEGGGTYRCAIDAGAYTACSSGSTFPVSGEGSHTFRVKQVDAAGNVGDPAEHTWTLDVTSPSKATVTSRPTGSTQSTNARFTFTGDEAGGSFECRYGSDGQWWVPCDSPTDVTGLGEGAKRFSIRQLDAAGNASDPEVTTWTVDVTAPGGPAVVTKPATRSNATSPTFAWTGAEGGGTYQCSLDSGAYAACTSGSTFPVSGEGSHTFRVKQVDAAGNVSDPAEHTWTLDTTKPSAPVLATKPAARVNTSSQTISWTGTEGGGSFQCAIDEGAFAACTSGFTFAFGGEGAHTFEVRQIDVAGNVGTVTKHTWTLDTTNPGTPTLTGKPASLLATRSATFTFTGDEAAGRFECRDGADFEAWSTCTSPVVLAGRQDGTNRFSIRQVDAAGNVGTPEVVMWTVDVTGPAKPAFTETPGLTKKRETWFRFIGEAGVEGVGAFECKRDSEAWRACSSPADVTGYATGAHTFSIRQIDEAGNVGATEVEPFDADLTGPAQPVVKDGPQQRTKQTSATFEFQGADGTADRLECRLNGGAWTPCRPGDSYNDLADGEHLFEVRQRDVNDNPGEIAGLSWAVDATKPAKPTLTGTPPAETTSRSIEVQIDAEPGALVECAIDGHAWSICDLPLKLDGINRGAHTVKVRVTDLAGNISDVAAFSWTVVETKVGAPVTPQSHATPQTSVAPKTTATTPKITPAEHAIPAVTPKLTGLTGSTTITGGTSSAVTITVRKGALVVGCAITSTVLTSCKVDVYADVATGTTARAAAATRVLVGTGASRKADSSPKLQVDVTLNATGRKLLRESPEGLNVSVAISGQPVQDAPLKARGVVTLVRERVNAVVGGFAVRSATLAPAAKRQLARLAKQVNGTAVAIRVVGHTDSSSSDADYLRSLGKRRAQAVVAYLRAHGVTAEATLVSQGAENPVASNATGAGRAMNRRVELSIAR